MKKRHTIAMITLLITTGTACDRSRHDKGYEYFPDMAHAITLESWSQSNELPGKQTMQPPVSGTVPTHALPYHIAATPQGRTLAGATLANHITPDISSLNQGKIQYNIFCAQCHGITGSGDGLLYITKKYPLPPPSLITDSLKNTAHGEIYHVITKGWGVMGAHESLITRNDRWHIINFIQHTLQNQ